ncbi:hypothetical protein, partial [Clostridium sp. DL1XJH146]
TLEQLFILVVGSGTKNHHVEQIVQHLAAISKNFSDLAVLKTMNLLEIPGIGQANQSRILAILELCERLNHHQCLNLQQPITIKNLAQHL